MTRFEDAVRHDLAAAPLPHPVERVRRRARRRRLRAWVSGLLALVAVGAGTVAVIRSVQRHPTVNVSPGVTPPTGPPATAPKTSTATATTTSTSTTPATIPRCRVGQLRAAGGWQGVPGGSMGGEIWLTNTATLPCSLSGRPGIRLLNERGTQLDVQSGKFEDGLPDASVALEPGAERGAEFAVAWQNWCGSTAPLTVQVVLPQSRVILRVTDRGFGERPRCDNPNATSAIATGHMEVPPS
jgi:hypothetical protein